MAATAGPGGSAFLSATGRAAWHDGRTAGNEPGPLVIRIQREGLRGEEIAALLARAWPLIHTQIETGAMLTITGDRPHTRSAIAV